MGRDEALGRIDDYFLEGAFEADLARRVAFKTESNLEGCEDALQEYLAGELVPYLSSMNFYCKIHPNPRSDAGPILVARRQEDNSLPTLMTYGHGDVIAGYGGQWIDDMDPWRITRVGHRW